MSTTGPGAGSTREERLAAAARGMTLALHAQAAPERAAIVSPRGSRTFAEVNANANRLVRALRSRGIGAGDSLVLVCASPSSPRCWPRASAWACVSRRRTGT